MAMGRAHCFFVGSLPLAGAAAAASAAACMPDPPNLLTYSCGVQGMGWKCFGQGVMSSLRASFLSETGSAFSAVHRARRKLWSAR